MEFGETEDSKEREEEKHRIQKNESRYAEPSDV